MNGNYFHPDAGSTNSFLNAKNRNPLLFLILLNIRVSKIAKLFFRASVLNVSKSKFLGSCLKNEL